MRDAIQERAVNGKTNEWKTNNPKIEGGTANHTEKISVQPKHMRAGTKITEFVQSYEGEGEHSDALVDRDDKRW